jgi:hypothetical protein
LLDVIAPAIDGIPLQRLRDPMPDPGMYRSAWLVVPLHQPDMFTRLDALLSQLRHRRPEHRRELRHRVRSSRCPPSVLPMTCCRCR